MKVAIDISQIIYGTGVSNYTKELVSNLSKQKDVDLKLFAGTLRRKADFESYNVKLLPLSPTLADLLWNRLHILSIERLIGTADVIHTSDWSEPPSSLPKVTTVHDLSPILFPEQSNSKIVSVHGRKLDLVKKESKAIIVPSKATKDDLVSMGFDKDKIYIIYEALPTHFKVDRSQSPIIDGKYILSVGTSARKNIQRTYQAYQEVKNELNLQKYVVVGEKPKNPIRGVIYTGKVSDSDLANIYANSRLLAYASLYEGFGLPILEAFASRIPVLTSNISSMPEVAGKAAVLVDPKRTSDISKGIIEAIRGKKVLVKKGVKQLGKFSWHKNAKQTIDVYKKVI